MMQPHTDQYACARGSGGKISLPFAVSKGTARLNLIAWECAQLYTEWYSHPLAPSAPSGQLPPGGSLYALP